MHSCPAGFVLLLSKSIWRSLVVMRQNILFFFAISWAAPTAYGSSQARGRIRAVAASIRQSHSNTGSEPRLQPTPQLTATLDP